MTPAKPRSLRDASGKYQRPDLARSAPDRRFTGYYRTAEGDVPGTGGRPLRTVEEAVVHAMRLAYRVADEQISRSQRLANRLKQAGDANVGPDSDLQALDGVERLGLKLMMALLSWLQAAAADQGSPLRNLASSNYRLLGNLFGLMENMPRPAAQPADPRSSQGGTTDPAKAPRHDVAGPAHTPTPTPTPMPTPASGPAGGQPGETPAQPLRVKYTGTVRRVVRNPQTDLPPDSGQAAFQALTFYCNGAPQSPVFTGDLTLGGDGGGVLALKLSTACPAGRWSAAVIDADGFVVGAVELELT